MSCSIQRISNCPNEKSSADYLISLVDSQGNELIFEDLIDPEFQLAISNGDILIAFGDRVMTSLTIKFNGDDLALYGNTDNRKRRLSFQGSYTDSDGDIRPITHEAEFSIVDQQAQTSI
jgi:hypothetical protein